MFPKWSLLLTFLILFFSRINMFGAFLFEIGALKVIKRVGMLNILKIVF